MADSGAYAVVILLAVASFLSFTGSFLIIIAALINKKLRGFTHILIINQAAADMLLSATSVPLRALRIAATNNLLQSTTISSASYCIHTTFLTIVMFGASVFSLFLLTLDRFLGIRYPMQYRIKARASYFIISIILSWAIPLIIGFLPLYVTQLQSKLNLQSSDSACVYGTVISLSYMIFVNVATLLLPLLVMISMYSLIIHKVHQSWSAVRRRVSKQRNHMRRASVVDPNLFRKKELKLARGVFCILFIHIICLTPIVVIDWMYTFSGIQSPPILIKVCLVLTYSNAVVDPLIYAAFSQEYKHTFWRLLTCKICHNDRRGSTVTASQVNSNLARIYKDAAQLNNVAFTGTTPPYVSENDAQIPETSDNEAHGTV